MRTLFGCLYPACFITQQLLIIPSPIANFENAYIQDACSPSFTLTLADVGCLLKFRIIPESDRGVTGNAIEHITKIVEPGEHPIF
jgi:hypothetical protein